MLPAPIFVAVSSLPSSLGALLASLGYRKGDVGVSARERYSMAIGSDTGVRAFVACVDLATGRAEIVRGSWGGANMFNTSNSVDLDTTPREIPAGCAVIQGYEGGGRPVSASILVRPDALAPMLPAGPTTSERERDILTLVRGYKGGAYRREALARARVTEGEISALCGRGMLRVNRAGALSITTEGKNACAGHRFDHVGY